MEAVEVKNISFIVICGDLSVCSLLGELCSKNEEWFWKILLARSVSSRNEYHECNIQVILWKWAWQVFAFTTSEAMGGYYL